MAKHENAGFLKQFNFSCQQFRCVRTLTCTDREQFKMKHTVWTICLF